MVGFESEYRTTTSSLSELSKLVETIKSNQKKLTEQQQTFDETDYATIGDLEKNYKVFVNRVQQQLSSIGGGGAVELQYLDDIVGIATNIDAYDGMYLQVDTSLSSASGHKFIFTEVSTAGAAGTWATDNVGVFTSKYVGINTTAAKEEYPLYVAPTGLANTTVVAKFDGDISVAGTNTFDSKGGP